MRKLYFLPFLFITLQIFAQSKENERFVLGFFTGLETQSLGVQPLEGHQPEYLAAGADRTRKGISAGVFLQKPIWRWLAFKPELSLAYVENRVIFQPDGPKPFRFFDAELPIHFVVTDWRRSDFPLRGSIVFGSRMGWNLAQNPSDLLEISPERFGLDLGLGVEIKIRLRRLEPVFLYSHGLNDLHFLEDAKYDNVVGKMVRDKLSLRVMVWKSRK